MTAKTTNKQATSSAKEHPGVDESQQTEESPTPNKNGLIPGQEVSFEDIGRIMRQRTPAQIEAQTAKPSSVKKAVKKQLAKE